MYATIIEDPVLGPYKIGLDKYNFSVFTEEVVKTGKNEGKRKTLNYGHFNALDSAIERIVTLMVLDRLGKVQRASLRRYLEESRIVTLRLKEFSDTLQNFVHK